MSRWDGRRLPRHRFGAGVKAAVAEKMRKHPGHRRVRWSAKAGGQGEIEFKRSSVSVAKETSMAQVISISERLARTPRRNEALVRDAQILFFTGIRYERFAAAPDRVELDEKGEPVKH